MNQKLADIVRSWPRTQPWMYSLDSAIAGLAPGVEVDVLEGDALYKPKIAGDHVTAGVAWWDNTTVEERRQALLDAVRWNTD